VYGSSLQGRDLAAEKSNAEQAGQKLQSGLTQKKPFGDSAVHTLKWKTEEFK